MTITTTQNIPKTISVSDFYNSLKCFSTARILWLDILGRRIEYSFSSVEEYREFQAWMGLVSTPIVELPRKTKFQRLYKKLTSWLK